MPVHGFLVSGNELQLQEFYIKTYNKLNYIDRRKNTEHYACMGKDKEFALETAKKCKVTMQEIIDIDGDETYPILIQGESPGWQIPN